MIPTTNRHLLSTPYDYSTPSGFGESRRSVDFVPLLRPDIEAAIQKCKLQVLAGVNIPWAFYRLARFYLLLGPEHERDVLTACAHGVRRTTSPDMLDSAIEAAEMLAGVLRERTDVKCVMRFLVAARQAKFPTADHAHELRRLATKRCAKLRDPVVIVAGGCDPAKGAEISAYRGLLRAALADFKGTIISGGTRQGISGLVGEVGNRSRDRIFTVGYLPSPPPRDGSASIDQRYRELRWTDGKDKFIGEDLDTMGEMEHGRWNVERLRQGWHYGKERDPEKRLSPHLVPWDDLEEIPKGWDRQAVHKFAALLPEIGMQIVPQENGAAITRNRSNRKRK